MRGVVGFGLDIIEVARVERKPGATRRIPRRSFRCAPYRLPRCVSRALRSPILDVVDALTEGFMPLMISIPAEVAADEKRLPPCPKSLTS